MPSSCPNRASDWPGVPSAARPSSARDSACTTICRMRSDTASIRTRRSIPSTASQNSTRFKLVPAHRSHASDRPAAAKLVPGGVQPDMKTPTSDFVVAASRAGSFRRTRRSPSATSEPTATTNSSASTPTSRFRRFVRRRRVRRFIPPGIRPTDTPRTLPHRLPGRPAGGAPVPRELLHPRWHARPTLDDSRTPGRGFPSATVRTTRCRWT